MFGQQPGRIEVAPPLEPFASATRVGHLRPLAERTGFSDDGRRFATPGGVSADAALPASPAFSESRSRFAAPGEVSAGAALLPAAPGVGESRSRFATPGEVSAGAALPAAPGVSKNRSRFATPLPGIESRTFARRGDAWGFQRVEPGAAPPPVERIAGLDSAADLASRRPAADIEAMLRQLLADHRILAARKLADAVPPDLASGGSLRRLLVVLAPPVVRRRTPARAGGADNIEWLRRHAGAHAGKWVALAGGELLAADESLAALRRRLNEIAPHAKPLLHRL